MFLEEAIRLLLIMASTINHGVEQLHGAERVCERNSTRIDKTVAIQLSATQSVAIGSVGPGQDTYVSTKAQNTKWRPPARGRPTACGRPWEMIGDQYSVCQMPI